MNNIKNTTLYPALFFVFSLIYLLIKIDTQSTSPQNYTQGYFGNFYEEYIDREIIKANHINWQECVRSKTGLYPDMNLDTELLLPEESAARIQCSLNNNNRSSRVIKFSPTKLIINLITFSIIPALAIFLITINISSHKRKINNSNAIE